MSEHFRGPAYPNRGAAPRASVFPKLENRLPFRFSTAENSLDDFKRELHQFSPNQKTQIVFPKLPKHLAVIDQEFETEGAPEPQQRNIISLLEHANLRIPHVTAVHSTGIKIQKRIRVQMPAMRGIAKGTVIRIVRRSDEDRAARLRDAMKFLHRRNDIRYVFDN